VWDHLIDKRAVGDRFTSNELASLLGLKPIHVSSFLSHLSDLEVLKVIGKNGKQYVWEVIEFKDVVIGPPRPRHESGLRKKSPRHFLKMSDFEVDDSGLQDAGRRLVHSLRQVGKELAVLRSQVLAACSTTELLTELMRREKRRGKD